MADYSVGIVDEGRAVSAALAGGNTLETDRNWPVDHWAGGGYVVCAGRQVRAIVSNTAAVLTIAGTWASAIVQGAPWIILSEAAAGALGVLQQHEHTAAVDGAVVVAAVDTLVLAANPARRYACITNLSGNWIYLAKGAAAALNQGLPLAPAGLGIYEITWDDLYTGEVRGIATAAGSSVAVEEGT